MFAPEIPVDEARRSRIVRSLGLLDTPPEERFDRVTRLAQRLFDVPVATMSLVDGDRVWRKSRQGPALAEIVRQASFCTHVVASGRVLVVEDTTCDLRFHDGPRVLVDGVRFYAGHPLRAPDGVILGTLALYDSAPRSFDLEEQGLLADLAAMLTGELIATLAQRMDALTGLQTRNAFEDVATYAMGRSVREGQPVTLLYLTIDGYDDLVDHGPTYADEALLEAATLLRTCFRSSDVLARVGPDAFCVLLTGARVDQVAAPLHRLETLAEAANLTRGESWELAFGIGFVGYDPTLHRGVVDLVEECAAGVCELRLGRSA